MLSKCQFCGTTYDGVYLHEASDCRKVLASQLADAQARAKELYQQRVAHELALEQVKARAKELERGVLEEKEAIEFWKDTSKKWANKALYDATMRANKYYAIVYDLCQVVDRLTCTGREPIAEDKLRESVIRLIQNGMRAVERADKAEAELADAKVNATRAEMYHLDNERLRQAILKLEARLEARR